MRGIKALILCRDFTLVKKRINSRESHLHHGKGSYLNTEGAILTTPNQEPPVLIFQEGNAIPKSVEKASAKPMIQEEQPSQFPALFKSPQQQQPQQPQTQPQTQPQHPLEGVKWETWYIPMLRGLNREHHGRLSLNIGKFVNRKTFPFLVIAFALAVHFLEQAI